ncbi:MAG: GH92 family glycosyl hydrolase [Bacteroidales bacterium]|jgi:predicted alpha-1,2-mannosidase
MFNIFPIHFLKVFLLLFFSFSFTLSFPQAKDYTALVNPFIGTGGHGHTYPGASLPFGMVQLSPDTRLTGWDGSSGYHYSDSIIYGFSHTHLSGTGCSDYGDILLMPMVNTYSLKNTVYASGFAHKNEKASPGYYSVLLKNGVDVELTVDKRTGFHRYTYPTGATPYIILDLTHRDEVIDSWVEVVNDTTIRGLRRSTAWVKDQWVFFVMRFSKPIKAYGIAINDTLNKSISKAEGKNIKAYFTFEKSAGNVLMIKVGISAVSTDGAYANMSTEIPGWDFNVQCNKAKQEWNKELGKIDVEGGTNEQPALPAGRQVVFYTALYHAMLCPNLYMDVDKQYRGTDLKIHKAEGFDNYTVFSLWDTYRAEHPLFTIIEQKRTNDFINTFINQYKNGGMLPVWELSGNETNCMIGYHSVSVIADAFTKSIKGYDTLKAFEAMKNSAESDKNGLKYYRKYNFIPGDKTSESVSKTLEYSYDDWCIAQMAKVMGKKDDYKEFIQRAQFYKNLFNPETGFMQAKTNGGWYKPFDATEVNFNYTEANCWQYTFNAQQDIDTYISLLGGKEKFANKLDTMFYGNYKLSGRTQADITGLIGQYAHGNEPDHHVAYLYDYAGKPWKTQEIVHKIQTEMYADSADGVIGNEDCGQMSAWLVMSAMGFYQVCPGKAEYSIGTPMFSKVVINLENGKKFIITAKNISKENFYVQSTTLNSKPYNKLFITYSDIMNGGQLDFTMGNTPNKKQEYNSSELPSTVITDYPIMLVPYVVADAKTFKKSMSVALKSVSPGQSIYYALNGMDPATSGILYNAPLLITETTHLKAVAKQNGMYSAIIDADFLKVPEGRRIKIKSVYDPQYSAGGPEGLIDCIRGDTDFRLGGWQGYQSQDFEAIVDLGKEQAVHKIAAGFLQDVGSWIWMPKEVEYAVSTDGINFKVVSTIKNTVSDKDYKPTIKDFTASVDITSCRYIRVKAKNCGTIPSWHLGAGGDAFIFIDEIIIE